MTARRSDMEGIEQLIRKYRQALRLPENVKYYSLEDYQAAEKQFVKFCLENGPQTEAGFSA